MLLVTQRLVPHACNRQAQGQVEFAAGTEASLGASPGLARGTATAGRSPTSRAAGHTSPRPTKRGSSSAPPPTVPPAPELVPAG